MLLKGLKQLKTGLMLLIIFSFLTGFLYPVLVTGLAQLFFPTKANGSIINKQEKSIGSLLIGQYFSEAKYFWSRPSATHPFPYNAEKSSGSNLSCSNPELLNALKNRIAILEKIDPQHKKNIPADLVTASASGLDPDISLVAAYYQSSRIAKARGIPITKIQTLIKNSVISPVFGILGTPRVNVLQLNLALDNLS